MLLKLAKLHGQPEIFYSIQGEGRNLGKPSVFVRTSLCNLHCRWCDTDYTWNWERTRFEHQNDAKPGYRKFKKQDQIVEIEPAEAARLALAFGCSNFILTGGEPMLQQATLSRFIEMVREKCPLASFEVETNGTIAPSPAFEKSIDFFNVSPKLANSGCPEKLRDRPKAMAFFSASPKATFKFVISAPGDLGEILSLRSTYGLAEERIFLMPEAADRRSLAGKRRWLVELCKKYGFNYSDRLHIEIFGSKKGV